MSSEPLIWYKDNDEELDYPVDWSDWLDGDTLASSVWVVPAGITATADTFSSPVTVIWLEGGGVSGTRHVLKNQITTTLGRHTERTITVIMRDR